jgi:hypothetical protein
MKSYTAATEHRTHTQPQQQPHAEQDFRQTKTNGADKMKDNKKTAANGAAEANKNAAKKRVAAFMEDVTGKRIESHEESHESVAQRPTEEHKRQLSLVMRHRCPYCETDEEATVMISPSQRMRIDHVEDYNRAIIAAEEAEEDLKVFLVSCPHCKTALTFAVAKKVRA